MSARISLTPRCYPGRACVAGAWEAIPGVQDVTGGAKGWLRAAAPLRAHIVDHRSLERLQPPPRRHQHTLLVQLADFRQAVDRARRVEAVDDIRAECDHRPTLEAVLPRTLDPDC